MIEHAPTVLEPLRRPEFIKQLNETDKTTGLLRLKPEHLTTLDCAIAVAAFMLKDKAAKKAAEVESRAREGKIGEEVNRLEALIADHMTVEAYRKADVPAALQELWKCLSASATAIATKPVPRGRPPERVLVWMVRAFAQVYREAGGSVAASETGDFARFLVHLAGILPRELHRELPRRDGKKDAASWLARYAKSLPQSLRGQGSLGK